MGGDSYDVADANPEYSASPEELAALAAQAKNRMFECRTDSSDKIIKRWTQLFKLDRLAEHSLRMLDQEDLSLLLKMEADVKSKPLVDKSALVVEYVTSIDQSATELATNLIDAENAGVMEEDSQQDHSHTAREWQDSSRVAKLLSCMPGKAKPDGRPSSSGKPITAAIAAPGNALKRREGISSKAATTRQVQKPLMTKKTSGGTVKLSSHGAEAARSSWGPSLGPGAGAAKGGWRSSPDASWGPDLAAAEGAGRWGPSLGPGAGATKGGWSPSLGPSKGDWGQRPGAGKGGWDAAASSWWSGAW